MERYALRAVFRNWVYETRYNRFSRRMFEPLPALAEHALGSRTLPLEADNLEMKSFVFKANFAFYH